MVQWLRAHTTVPGGVQFLAPTSVDSQLPVALAPRSNTLFMHSYL